MKATKTLAAINQSLEANQERTHRNHLGASILGDKCLRKVWYVFRWAKKEIFEGRMLRLFERGQLEENRFLSYLTDIGCEVWPIDPDTGKQWRIKFAFGHGGGSTDGVGRGCPDLPPAAVFLIENKTHGEKSYNELVKEGLCQSKPTHFDQMQIYMHEMQLDYGLYMAVNKNTDDLHLEIVQASPERGQTLIARGESIVKAESAPERINASPSFYICKWCHFRDICHGKELPERNCRTCRESVAVDGGLWMCRKYGVSLTTEQQQTGCAEYKLNPGIC